MKDAGRIFYFDRLGDDFDKYMSDYDVERRQFLVFSRLLENERLDGAKVLEVVCGTGLFSKRIAGLVADLTVLDIGASLVEKVARTLSCSGVVGDACNLPFAVQTFDAVISSECIEHTPNLERAIEEMCRVCRCGGVGGVYYESQ